MFTIQYKVSTNLRNPNSNTGIRKPWTEKPNTMDCKTAYHNTAKNDPKKKNSGAPPPNPWIHIADNNFGANAPKIDKGGPSRLPPFGASASRVGLVELGVKLHAKNIT